MSVPSAEEQVAFLARVRQLRERCASSLALAHAQCNRDKRDFLGDLWHLEHWVERNAMQGEVLARAFEGLHVVHDLAASRHVVRWSYAQAEQAGARVWLRENELRPLAPSWRALLPA